MMLRLTRAHENDWVLVNSDAIACAWANVVGQGALQETYTRITLRGVLVGESFGDGHVTLEYPYLDVREAVSVIGDLLGSLRAAT